ncbi:MAG: hypothetical protein Q8L64_00200 [bacterium]|nr:hypothetical protein [bacterium]
MADWSIGNQGILFPNESNGITTDPGKGVGDGICVAVAVAVGGTSVNVGGTGVGVGAGAHPLIIKTVIRTNKRNIDPIDFFMTLSPFDLIAQDCA